MRTNKTGLTGGEGLTRPKRPQWMQVRTAAPAVLLLVGVISGRASACGLAAFAHDPTCNSVYFQFSTTEPMDAYQVIVSKMPLGFPKTGTGVVDPAGCSTTGASGVVTGLQCGTTYRFVLKIKCCNGTWVTVKNFTFTTTACALCG